MLTPKNGCRSGRWLPWILCVSLGGSVVRWPTRFPFPYSNGK